MAELIDFHTHHAMASERRAVRRELIALAARARACGMTGAALVIDFIIAQTMGGEWPCEPDEK